jgi:hypothetical protein
VRPAEERAHELLDEGRVYLAYSGKDRCVALVAGRTDWYTVTANRKGVFCTCPVSGRVCSHSLAAQVAWAERARDAATEAAA